MKFKNVSFYLSIANVPSLSFFSIKSELECEKLAVELEEERKAHEAL